jgi:putative ABC transport system ATP-binding protein
MNAVASHPRIPEPVAASERIIIRTVGMKKIYRRGEETTYALRGVDVEIYTGEFITVMGPSGSGKSTFFNMIGALDSPSEGPRVHRRGRRGPAHRRGTRLPALPQDRLHFPVLQPDPVHDRPRKRHHAHGVWRRVPDEARKRGMELLDLVGLKDRWFHRPIEMSGGQQQRVAIARSLANQPGILLCDEPTANLDHHTGDEILAILQKLNKERGVTTICATHDHRMMNICDRLMWIRDGGIERIARRDEVEVELGHIE